MDPETKFKVQNSGKNMINIDTDDDSEQKSLDSDDVSYHIEPEEDQELSVSASRNNLHD